jgi:PadR family transcriptional regulator, regulatory protein PadR
MQTLHRVIGQKGRAHEKRTPRATENVVAVLEAMLSSRRRWYGLELARRAGIGSASIYVVLDRLEEFGWLTSEWEEIDPSEKGRPRRRLYRLTAEGKPAARELVAGYTPRAPRRPQPQPRHGAHLA